MFGTAEFERLLTDASKQLYVNNRATMRSGQLLATPNQVDTGDVELFFRGVGAGLVQVRPDGRFNTLDRPTAQGHWALLSRSAQGGWFNAEYLPQIAAYVEAILDLGYPTSGCSLSCPPRRFNSTWPSWMTTGG